MNASFAIPVKGTTGIAKQETRQRDRILSDQRLGNSDGVDGHMGERRRVKNFDTALPLCESPAGAHPNIQRRGTVSQVLASLLVKVGQHVQMEVSTVSGGLKAMNTVA